MDPVKGGTRGLLISLVSLVMVSCGFPRPADVPDPDATSDGPGYQLLVVTPAIATAGDTLTLEGTFAGTATVQFPGGASQAAMVLGEHRATVVVPEAATAGDLTVINGGATVGPLPFRRTSFALGLQPFRASYEQTDGARQSPTLRIARSSASTAVAKSWLYVVGGADGTGALNSVERAAINADGTIESFDLVGDVTLGEARSGHTSVVIGRSLFVLGGSGRGGTLNNVERAAINADGSIGTFSLVQGTTLVTARSGHTSVIIGNFLYVIGGAQTDGTKLASVERATIQPDGTLGPFALAPDVTLAAARSEHASDVIGNTLYIIGGDVGGGAPSGSVERAAINGDGSLGTFTAAPGTALSTPRKGHGTAVLGGAVYVIGGSNGNGPTGSVERAPISTDGALGPFAAVSSTSLNTTRDGQMLATVGNVLYAVGGRSNSGPIPTIERASLNADSAIDSFANSDIALLLPRIHDRSVILRDFVYVIGNSNAENTIEHALIRSDESLGTFTTVAGIALVTSRSSHTTALVGNSLYVIGGSGSTTLSSVERAVVNTDGSLSPFTTVSTTLKEARFGHVNVALGNYLYVISGIGINHNRLTSIERAVVNDDGTLGAFDTVSGVTLNTGRNYFTAVVTDNYLYVVGGLDDATGGTSSIERSPISSDGSLGPFTTVSNLVYARGTHASVVIGNAVYIVGGLIAGEHVSAVERATINLDGSLSEFGEVSANKLTETRARHMAMTAGNELYLIGGETTLPNGQITTVLNVEHANLR